MRKGLTTVAIGAALAVPLAAGTAVSAVSANANQGTEVYHSKLEPLNESGARGHATILVRGNELTVKLRARGLAPNLVHAQHIHGIGNSECPPASAAGEDGILSTVDGLPFYGPIVTSLTTEGDTSPEAGLNVEIMPVADDKGRIKYSRTFTVSPEIADNLDAFQIVQHGVDFNGNNEYDFSAGTSELDPALPQEATAPADCGTIYGH